MKKILHIVLLTIYLPAALGVGFDVHYCEGHVESVKVFSYEEKGCCCGNEPSTGCCEDEREFVKLADNSQVVPGHNGFKPVVVNHTPIFYTVFSAFSSIHVNQGAVLTAHAEYGPPIRNYDRTHIRLRSILI